MNAYLEPVGVTVPRAGKGAGVSGVFGDMSWNNVARKIVVWDIVEGEKEDPWHQLWLMVLYIGTRTVPIVIETEERIVGLVLRKDPHVKTLYQRVGCFERQGVQYSKDWLDSLPHSMKEVHIV